MSLFIKTTVSIRLTDSRKYQNCSWLERRHFTLLINKEFYLFTQVMCLKLGSMIIFLYFSLKTRWDRFDSSIDVCKCYKHLSVKLLVMYSCLEYRNTISLVRKQVFTVVEKLFTVFFLGVRRKPLGRALVCKCFDAEILTGGRIVLRHRNAQRFCGENTKQCCGDFWAAVKPNRSMIIFLGSTLGQSILSLSAACTYLKFRKFERPPCIPERHAYYSPAIPSARVWASIRSTNAECARKCRARPRRT